MYFDIDCVEILELAAQLFETEMKVKYKILTYFIVSQYTAMDCII